MAIDAQGNALAYGKDFGFGNSELNGTVICADCKKLSSTDQSVIIIKADGSFAQYGYLLDSTHRTFAE